MEKYKEAELKLNKYPDPSGFHDMSVVNMKIKDDNIYIKLILVKYMDKFGILEDDDHYAILEVKYSGVTIKSMNLCEIIDFRGLDVLYLCEEDDGDIAVDFYDTDLEIFFEMKFSYKSYHWSVCDVIEEDEFYDYLEALGSYDKILEIKEVKTPKWANFENEDEIKE